MKKITVLLLTTFILSSCSLLRIHKADVDQGNLFTQTEINRLHPGMSQTQVREIMGNPLLVNIFTPNQVIYVYTFKPGYSHMTEKKITLIFEKGRLQKIQQEYLTY